MRKFIFLITFSILCLFILCSSVGALEISAKGAVLIEAESGDIVYGKNEHIKLPMASTTKIMTALVVLDNAELDEIVTIEPCMVGIEGSSVYLRVGEKLTVQDLLYALLLESANDASVALAIHVSGSIDDFAVLMNEKAKELGLESTHFSNPHGLDQEEHYTTPYELGVIAASAMKNEAFTKIVSTKKAVIPSFDGEGSRVLINHNKLLRSYEGAIGIKTGFTKKCGRCLVSCAVRDGVMLICVTLNAPNDWQDHKNMLDYGFTQYESISLATPYCYTVELNAIGGNKGSFLAQNCDTLQVTLKRQKHNICAVLETNRFVSAPIRKGDLVGAIVYYDNDKVIGRVPLYAKESVEKLSYKKSFFERLFS